MTSDPINDFYAYEAEREDRLTRCPICCNCGEFIQTETAVRVNGNFYCECCEDSAWQEIRSDYLEGTEAD